MYIIKGKFGASTWVETVRDSKAAGKTVIESLRKDGAIRIKMLRNGLIVYLWDIQKGRVV